MQHFPHIDSELNVADNNSVLNVLIYLDKQEDGGTAIYEGDYIENNEAQNLLYPCTETLKIKKLLNTNLIVVLFSPVIVCMVRILKTIKSTLKIGDLHKLFFYTLY